MADFLSGQPWIEEQWEVFLQQEMKTIDDTVAQVLQEDIEHLIKRKGEILNPRHQTVNDVVSHIPWWPSSQSIPCYPWPDVYKRWQDRKQELVATYSRIYFRYRKYGVVNNIKHGFKRFLFERLIDHFSKYNHGFRSASRLLLKYDPYCVIDNKKHYIENALVLYAIYVHGVSFLPFDLWNIVYTYIPFHRFRDRRIYDIHATSWIHQSSMRSIKLL